MPRLFALLSMLALLPLVQGLDCAPTPNDQIELEGLGSSVRVLTDGKAVPHIIAEDDLDVARVQGYVHARDRFWAMDLTRRQVDGTLAELLGGGEIGSDIQMRVFGLDRAAQRSLDALAIESPREVQVLEAYAEGVNSYLARIRAGEAPLPPEYVDIELSASSLRDWTAVEVLSIGKAIAASLSLDIDAGRIEQLQDYCEQGALQGFDGATLLFQDVNRIAPMDPSSTVPDATGSFPFTVSGPPSNPVECEDIEVAAAGVRRYMDKVRATPFLMAATQRRENEIGSNEWGVGASKAFGGFPIIANDPHLSLGTPATFYENHLIVRNDPVEGPMNVSGVTFPGVPAVILGQTQHVTWGATTNPMDVTDVFRDKLVKGDPGCKDEDGNVQNFCIVTGGELHHVVLETTTYLQNTPNDGVIDNLVGAPVGLDSGALILTVPFRSFGPIVDVEDFGIFFGAAVTETEVLTAQFTGFHATREVRTFRLWNRASNLDDFLAGLAGFDFGSQNWAYADDQGNLGYFSSAENPLRVDLQAGAVVGLPPFFVRDGVSGDNNWIPDPDRTQGQSIPFQVLPAEEMPQTLNPANGFFVNANNDPAGTSLDNDPLNQRRLSDPNAIYYLSPGYAQGMRSGRITQLVRDQVEAGQPISVEDMKRFQLNNQQLDAELMVPFVVTAFANAEQPGAPAELAAYADDAAVTEAAGRLAAWDFSTPTGIPEGWDASDQLGVRSETVPADEVTASVAATIYNMWRGKAIRAVIDARLAALSVPGVGGGEALTALHNLLSVQPFTGVGASGVDFFPEPASLDAAARRDIALLAALREALDALASPEFAPAFGESTDQDDYRWGKLHRKTFGHELGGDFNVPPASGFDDLAPDLPGLARDGGYNVVNASGFNARSTGLNSFRFGGGPVRRYVGAGGPGTPDARIVGYNAVPSIVGTNSLQLRFWLTGDHHVVRLNEAALQLGTVKREEFVPPSVP